MRGVIGGSVAGYRLISADWWLADSAIDLDFEGDQYHDADQLVTDALAAQTVLMLHCDGADGSSNISDSTGRHFIAPSGGAQIDTAQSKFGGASVYLGGSQTDVLNAFTSGAGATIGTADYTVDFWWRSENLSTDQSFFWFHDGSNEARLAFQASTTGLLLVYSGIGNVISATGLSLSINTWYHVAITRASGVTKLFLDGTQIGSTYSPDTKDIPKLDLAMGYASTYAPIGWIDEYRILKGVAAWTANFTPPTAPYDVGIGPYDVLSCSRASIGYAQNADGTLTQFPANALRITDLGLLVEDARTNLILRSQEFDNSAWTTSGIGVTINADVAVAPDGTTTADKLTATTGDSYLYQAVTITNGVPTTFSIYLKADTPTALDIYEIGAGGDNLGTCNVTTTWQRFSFTWTSTGIGAQILIGGAGSFSTGEIVYAWGAQLEAGAFASSYIPTTTAAATRAADTVTCIGGLDTILSAAPQSLLMDVKTYRSAASNGDRLLVPSSGQASFASGNTSFGVSAISDCIFPTSTFATGVKVAWAQDISSSSTVGDGALAYFNTEDTNLWPDVVLLYGSGVAMWGYLRRLTAWTSRLADATLQSLTNP